jgi:hypothetical protein
MTLWSQVGLDIDGEAARDQSGRSVSLSSDGSTVAIGAPYNDGNGDSQGHVRVYHLINNSWTQKGSDIDGEVAIDQSGWSVSLSSDGSIVAIGARDIFGKGHVRVYKYENNSWGKLGLDIDGATAGDQSGWSVSLSGDGSTVAIGAPFNDDNGNNSGHVRVYKYENNSWGKLGLDIKGATANDKSGYSVSLSSDGSTVAIGAPNNDGKGHVRVYKYENNSWGKLGLDIDGETAGDSSGYSVSLSSDGTTVAIGAPKNDTNTKAGHVRVYQYVGNSWNQLGGDIKGAAADDYLGTSVSLSSDGSTVAIGVPINTDGDYNRTDSGHVRVYHLINNSWTQKGLDIEGAAASDRSGWSVSLSSDGSTVAIGAPYKNNVRVYEFKASSGASGDPFLVTLL